MRDLRKQALESHKTVSRKQAAKMASHNASPAGSKPSSRHGSTLHTPAMSRATSRSGSRANSDDDEYLSDDTIFSGGSELGSIEDLGDPSRGWEENLKDRMDELADWKRSSTEGRELCLRTFARMLQSHYALEEIDGREQELLTSFLRSIKNESSDTEVIRALKAIEMLMVTSGDSNISENAGPTIQKVVNYSASIPVKTQAIRTWVFLTYYAGLADEDIIKSMDFLIEIIESDGASIEAEDEAEPVTAAIEGYSFLATIVQDLSDYSAEHSEALLEQLDSNSAAVQVAAGEALALLYEKSYTEPEVDESVHKDDHNAILGDDEKIALVRRYQASTNYREVVGKLVQVSTSSGRSSRRKDVKAARVNFKDILASIENPTWGPRYSTAEGRDHGRVAGNTMSIQIANLGVMKIDKWWKLISLHSLKKVLQGGFIVHYEHNPLIFETLPVLVAKKAHHSSGVRKSLPRQVIGVNNGTD